MNDMDPSLLQDFLTESSELVDRLDADLVKLEAAEGGEQKELLNGCFRALHTIKGAAGFLGLDNVTQFAHIAEDALNRLRKGEIDVSPHVMDLLLQSADVVRNMIEQLADGNTPDLVPDQLVSKLKSLVNESADHESQNNNEIQQDDAELPGKPLDIGSQKLDLIEYMIADLRDYAAQFDEVVGQLRNHASRSDAADHLAEIADNMVKTADFFELDDLTRTIRLLLEVAPKLKEIPDDVIDEVIIRIQAARFLIDQQAHWLEKKRALNWPLDTLIRRLNTLADGKDIEPEVVGRHNGDVMKLLHIDGVVNDITPKIDNTTDDKTQNNEPADTRNTIAAEQNVAPQKEDSKTAAATTQTGQGVAEQTIRVEVGRLESLLNLVGQLVLNKNRILGLTRNIRDAGVPQEVSEGFAAAANDLDRLMSELQIGVMRTRMQPLAKLFDRYPRVIRDMARMTDKKINIEITGKDTEVDKSVIELLADPLVHLLRNSADHGIETPAVRNENAKNETGTIRLAAEHQGSHVRVAVSDDGKGLDREVLGRKAVEKGLTTPEQLAQMNDDAVFRFIFHAGFSTADQVSNLSGRGVGMDVVNTNIGKMNGTINVSSKKGLGTTIEILIPLTVAIMPAMVVGVGSHLYCIPLQCIIEIVKPDAGAVHAIKGQKVMRLRDAVLPLVNMQQRLNETECPGGGRFAVVVAAGAQHAGLIVDKLVGQQEIVIKPLDDQSTKGGPFSGATIQENGEVSLILDIIKLVRQSQTTTGLRKAA